MSALPASADGALILLGDMPEIRSSLLNRMIAAFSPADGRSICVAVHDGRRGNPVLWARSLFGEIAEISGDPRRQTSAANRMKSSFAKLNADAGVLRDVDTPDALARLARRGRPGRMSDPLYGKALLRLAAEAAGRRTPVGISTRKGLPIIPPAAIEYR